MFEYLAREFKFFVSLNNSTTWTEVGGIASWSWTEDGTDVDVTDFDDEGWDHSMVARRKAALAIAGNWLVDASTGARDAGQALIEDQARKVGTAGLMNVKIETRAQIANAPMGVISGQCSVKLGKNGGGNDDKMPFEATFMIKGKPTFSGCFA